MELTQDLRNARIAICEDIIMQLKLKKIKPKSNTYLQSEIDGTVFQLIRKGEKTKVSLQALIRQNKILNCNVCMRGSLLLSRTSLYNQKDIEIYRDFSEYRGNRNYALAPTIEEDALSIPEFSIKELAGMELTFELKFYPWTYKYLSTEEMNICIGFTNGEENVENRMKKVAEYIIKNNGLFII